MSTMSYREPNEVLWRGVRPAHKGTQVAKNNGVTNGTAIIHTPTNTLYITALTFFAKGTATGAGKWGIMAVRDGGDNKEYEFFHCHFEAVGQELSSCSFDPPVEVPAGYDVYITSNDVAVTVYGSVFGWEE